ncbi:MAG: hypothetical protein ACOCT0_05680, partial [Halobacteriota archaeon]
RGNRVTTQDDDLPPTTEAEFQRALNELIYQEVIQSVNVEGGWDVSTETEDGLPDFAIEILKKKS